MKILIVGASGTIGQAVVNEKKHEIIRVGRNGADVKVDITSVDSIKKMYEQVGKVDAVINAAGRAHFSPVSKLTPEQNEITIESKLKGQINLVLSAAMANGGVKAFVKGASVEMPRGIRINSVSPNVLQESMHKYADFFPGFDAVPAQRVALAYRKSVEGVQTGQNYEVY